MQKRRSGGEQLAAVFDSISPEFEPETLCINSDVLSHDFPSGRPGRTLFFSCFLNHYASFCNVHIFLGQLMVFGDLDCETVMYHYGITHYFVFRY